MKYRPEIDGLRAIAVLAVFFYHLKITAFSGGYVGVDVFFVISGYLITSILQKDLDKKSFSITKFYDRRFRRIMPALYFVLAVATLICWVLFMHQEMKLYCKSLLSTMFFYSNFQFWNEAGYFDMDSEIKPLLHTWSLAIEEQFYVVFPTFLYLIERYLHSKKKIILGVILFLSLGLNISQTQTSLDKAFYFTPGRVWELLLGSLLALNAFPKFKTKAWNEFASLVGMLMVGIGIFVFTEETKFPGLNALIPCLGTALMIHGTGSEKFKTTMDRFLSTSPMTGAGKISYSLYLWHWPLIVFAKYAFMRELGLWDQLGIFFAATITAYFSWKMIEQPFRTKKGIFENSKKWGFALIVLTIILSGFAYIGMKNGYKVRFSSEVEKYSKGALDTNLDRKNCHSISIERIKKHDLCKLGKEKSKPDFIVWGDSYADAMMPGLKQEAEKKNTYGWFVSSSGCAPLLGDKQGESKSAICETFNREMVKIVRELKIQNVLLISAWRPKAEPSSEMQGQVDQQSLKLDPKRNQSFIQKYGKVLQVLKESGAHIWIVHKIPKPDFNVPSYLARYEFQKKEKSKLKIPYQKFGIDYQLTSQMISELEKYSHFGIIDPSKILCSDISCDIEKNGDPLYYDHHHLSATGAKYVMPAFDGFFNEVEGKN